MTGTLVFLLLAVLAGAALVAAVRRSRERSAAERRAELEPVAKLAFEDITALGVELQALDADLAGRDLDEGARADYQRALDDYESAKTAADRIAAPEDIRHVTEIVEDGRYAIACVRARVAGEKLPVRRAPCFFDPRHGPSVRDVTFTPPSGSTRQVPACELDAERVQAGADPHSRQVMVGSRRVPYWEGGQQYAPYAAGYYGSFLPMNILFAGMMFGAFGGMAFGGMAFGDGLGGELGGGGDMGGDTGDGGGDFFDSGFFGDGGFDGGGFDL